MEKFNCGKLRKGKKMKIQKYSLRFTVLLFYIYKKGYAHSFIYSAWIKYMSAKYTKMSRVISVM